MAFNELNFAGMGASRNGKETVDRPPPSLSERNRSLRNERNTPNVNNFPCIQDIPKRSVNQS
jgi:hypothetical protein